MIGVVIFMAGALAAAQNVAAPAPSLPYLKNPSVTYSECIAAAVSAQAIPRVDVIGAGQCRQARAVLWSAIRYEMAINWSDIADSRADARRIQRQIDDSVRSILESYEADLQRWLDANAGRR